ncbi:bifunctional 2-polyprenyl-6-hydroxyphenol methylase/3-demethylubiquinol 3-O-methyltransferase UbiG [Streptomyces sp. DH37]|uniref:class I SAM-dependent methyltransferase n=1 Tax=Streptomyces sp. DH37 TaxID=3040122 RepID=UPI002442ABDE|nr:class I SAM-dependent methyltransferase [Streptomyces sp. DH37]MDG9701674.1 class I SAM-dependent methyltransferase [Streptomyces sp. DH37]
MPTSIDEGKDWSLERFRRHRPDTVCDVGPGEGTYARLFRPEHRGVWWTAVEIHKPYITKYKLKNTKTRTDRYDEIHVMDAREAPDHLYFRDLVICGDVLEHMPREDAVALLQRIEAAGAWHILVSVPIVEAPQGEVDGNPAEAHVHHWDADDMDGVLRNLGGGVETYRGDTLGVWWWSRRG